MHSGLFFKTCYGIMLRSSIKLKATLSNVWTKSFQITSHWINSFHKLRIHYMNIKSRSRSDAHRFISYYWWPYIVLLILALLQSDEGVGVTVNSHVIFSCRCLHTKLKIIIHTVISAVLFKIKHLNQYLTIIVVAVRTLIWHIMSLVIYVYKA